MIVSEQKHSQGLFYVKKKIRKHLQLVEEVLLRALGLEDLYRDECLVVVRLRVFQGGCA